VLHWIILLSACVVGTIVGTLLTKRPIQVATGISLLAGMVAGFQGASNSPLWMLGSIIVIVCSLPVTIVTGIVVENLMDKSGSNPWE
jgi:hypothetical protein